MFPVTCTNAQKLPITCAPDGPIDGPLRITVISGDGTFTQDPTTPLSFTAVSGTAVVDPTVPGSGVTVYGVAGDKRLGPDVELLEDTVELTVTAPPIPDATKLGFSAGPAEAK